MAAPSDTPSMRDVYTSDFWRTVEADRLRRANVRTEEAREPLASGVVPLVAYEDMFAPLLDARMAEVAKAKGQPAAPPPGTLVESLTGERVPFENFTHNNMQPFFSGRMKQSIDARANAPLLESFTGRGGVFQQKQEVPPLFSPTVGLTNVCGMPDVTQDLRSHIVKPIARNNDFPIEPIIVGPGLGQGYTATPAGGFQQATTLDYIRPKTVDELRPLSDPKETYEIPTAGPAGSPVSKPGKVGKMEKRLPDTYYEQTPDMWLRTTGAVLKETERPVFDVKPTARPETHVPYVGTAGRGDAIGRGAADDYGKASITVYANERMTTETKTVVANLKSIVSAVIAPFLDIVRHNPKEYLIDAPRPNGMLQAQMPGKPALYDPVNWATRTTVKETTIHDAEARNMAPRMPEKPVAYDPVDWAARTTVKETTVHDEEARNMAPQMPGKATVYDPINYMMRTTVKETTIHDGTIMNLHSVEEAGTARYEDDAKTTIKEMTPSVDTWRNLNAHTYRTIEYNPDEVAKTTLKEMVELAANESGYIGHVDRLHPGAYDFIEVLVPDTQKQFVSDYQYFGDAGAQTEFRPPSHEAADNMLVDPTKEYLDVAAAYVPGAGGTYTDVSADMINMKVDKLASDSVAARETPNIGRTYQLTVPEVQPCAITSEPQEYGNISRDRIDPAVLAELRTNPYNISINPLRPINEPSLCTSTGP